MSEAFNNEASQQPCHYFQDFKPKDFGFFITLSSLQGNKPNPMKNQHRLMSAALLTFGLLASTFASAQRVSDIYINKMLLKIEDDGNASFATKDYMYETGKNNTAFEVVGVRMLDNSEKYLVFGKHEVTADHQVNNQSVDIDINATHGKDELKFHMARFPKVNYTFVSIDENDAKDLLENVKQMRSNYIASDTLKIKDELQVMQYRLNKDFAVSMTRGKGGSSAKYFELWIGNRKQQVSSDKFIYALTQFLGTEE